MCVYSIGVVIFTLVVGLLIIIDDAREYEREREEIERWQKLSLELNDLNERRCPVCKRRA